jgi:hypothetical protein
MKSILFLVDMSTAFLTPAEITGLQRYENSVVLPFQDECIWVGKAKWD